LASAAASRCNHWPSEALTTFMADYALAEIAGDTEAREMRRGWLGDFAVLPAAQDRPSSPSSSAATQPHK
jgi:hypothetical protein